jgi:uncharacterized protein YuzE
VAPATIADYLKVVPAAIRAPNRFLWTSYDVEADVLYINFEKPSCASDSELTEDDVILRYRDRELVGLTVLHASRR